MPPPSLPDAEPVQTLPRPGKQARAITTATGDIASPISALAQAEITEARDPAREAILLALEQELLTLLNQTTSVLVRVKRSAPASRSDSTLGPRRRPAVTTLPASDTKSTTATEPQINSPFGAIVMGREVAQNIERRARGMLLENSLTSVQQDRIDRILQSTQDLLCALQAARYAWQIALLLPKEDQSGQTALPRLKRVTECVIEMSSRVALAIEGREGAVAAVAEQYRAFLTVNEEISTHFSRWRESGVLSQTARRLVRAALWSTTVAAESMVKVAARFALPLETSREVHQDHEKHKHLDRGDDLLAPLRHR